MAGDSFLTEAQNNLKASSGNEMPTGGKGGLYTLIGNIIKVVMGLLGLYLFYILIIGGYEYMTSGGETEKVKKAKKSIAYAIIGIMIIVLSYAITSFVINKINSSIAQ